MQTGLDGPGGKRCLTGLDLRQHLRTPRDATRDHHLGCSSRRAKSRSWLDAEVALEELGACLHATHRSVGIARRTQAANEQDMGVLVVWVEADEFRGVMCRVGGPAARQ